MRKINTAAMPATTARTIVTCFLVPAMVCLSLAPPQHIHRAGIEGRSEALVHAHAPEAASGRDTWTDEALENTHGDHRLAVALSHDSTTASRVSLSADAAVTRAVVVSPEIMIAARRDPSDARPHGPPRPAGTNRGPPPAL